MAFQRKAFWTLMGLVVSAFLVVTISFLSAADLTTVDYTISSVNVGQPADHVIQFTTPSGVAAGENIMIYIPSEFDTTSVDYTDIDVHAGGTDLSLAAAPSGTTWGAYFSGGALYIESGSGTIAPGSLVTIEIGLVASGGDAQLINPAIAGNYPFHIRGSFADRGNFTVLIRNPQMHVTATVLPEGDGGGGGGGQQIALHITNVMVLQVTDTTARIQWQTNKPSSGTVSYGETTNYELGEVLYTDLSYLHTVVIENLDPDTLYHFQVDGTDLLGYTDRTSDYTFRTSERSGVFLYLKALPEKRLPRTGNFNNNMRVKIYESGTNNVLLNKLIETNDDGEDTSIGLEGLSFPITVDIEVKGYSHLSKFYEGLVLTGEHDSFDLSEGGTVFLQAGDVNLTEGDNVINGIDLSILKNKIYRHDKRYDLNRDGKVNGLDFAMTVANFLNKGKQK